MDNVCELVVYTSNAVLSFNIEITTDNFQERLVQALEEGTVLLDTAEGSKLVLNAINVVAIEICEAGSESGNAGNTPPGVEKGPSFL